MNTQNTPKINPNAKIREINVDPKVYEEFRTLTGKDFQLAAAHLNQCIKEGTQPVALKDWVYCPDPDCGYRCPGNLVGHIAKEHGGVAALASRLGILPQQIILVTEQAQAKYKAAGARGTAAAQANKAAAQVAAPVETPGL